MEKVRPNADSLLALTVELIAEVEQSLAASSGETRAEERRVRDQTAPADPQLERKFFIALAAEAATYLYYASTLLEVFNKVLTEKRLRELERTGGIEELTTARADFALGPRLAWERIDAAREHLDLQPQPQPKLLFEV